MSPRRRDLIFGDALRSLTRIPEARKNAGTAAVEFALLFSLFTMIAAGTIDYGYLIYAASELTAAVSAGAQYAEKNAVMVGSNPSGLAADISSVVNNANGPSWAASTVDVNNGNDTTGCYCPTGSPGNWSWGSAVACGSACGGGGVAGQFVTITASHTASPLFPTYNLTYNGTISRSAMVETQ
jgi:Flp pilus assembly protein TadG